VLATAGDWRGMTLERLKEFGVGDKGGWVELHVGSLSGELKQVLSLSNHWAHDRTMERLVFVMQITYSWSWLAALKT
jgi:hypothetical protein